MRMTGHAGFDKPQDCSVTVTLRDAGGVEIFSVAQLNPITTVSPTKAAFMQAKAASISPSIKILT